MTIAYTGGNRNGQGTTTAPTTGVHGVDIFSGDFVVIGINSNNAGSLTHGGSEGTAFNIAGEHTPSGKSERIALFWKVAGASEPTSYTFGSGSGQAQTIIKVFTSATDVEVDAAATTSQTPGTQAGLLCDAASGVTVADGAVSIVFGAKDNRFTGNHTYDTVDSSYVSPIGNTADEAAAMAHRIWTAGGTDSSVDITTTENGGFDGMSANNASIHMSFVESGGGGGGANPHYAFGHPFKGPFSGPIG